MFLHLNVKDGGPLIVNMRHVVSVFRNRHGTGTSLHFIDGDSTIVEETFGYFKDRLVAYKTEEDYNKAKQRGEGQ